MADAGAPLLDGRRGRRQEIAWQLARVQRDIDALHDMSTRQRRRRRRRDECFGAVDENDTVDENSVVLPLLGWQDARLYNLHPTADADYQYQSPLLGSCCRLGVTT